MFDVFYSGTAPNLFAHERAARDIEHARQLSRTRLFWWVDYLTDYTDFDFLWEPSPWQANQLHVWPSQHQASGGTCLVPVQGWSETNREHAVLPRTGCPTVLGIDHGWGAVPSCARFTRYISDYLGTLRRLLASCTTEWAWVVSSVCDYSTFDFTWHPSEWQQDMLHVFPSQDPSGTTQVFGDTFYIHVPSFLRKSADVKLLEWFETLAFQGDRPVPRLPWPQVAHSHASQVTAVQQHEFVSPYAVFTVGTEPVIDMPAVNLWREATKTVAPLSSGAGVCLIPRQAKTHLNRQLYDYAYIDKNNQHMYQDQLLDIVFIDAGEPNAEENYLHLRWAAERANHIKIHRSSGVTGRVAAYQAAARLSTTPWFFAVFAKLRVNSDFDWTWQPDRLQEPKHYIFHAFNPINGLTYGHQAMIAYNRELVLNNTGVGLDFTLDSAHEVVPILSGTAEYANSRWSAWRTAFRECIKLKCNTDVESQYRLNKWRTVAMGMPYGQYSIWGAEDAVEYYDAVAGDFDELKKSYDWAWLASYALLKRNLTPNQ